MKKYTEEQVTRANQVNLVDFLSGRGMRFKKSGSEFRCLNPDSLVIRGNEWYRHSRAKGGGPIDLMMELYCMDFVQAVSELLNGEVPGEENKAVAEKAVSQISDTAQKNRYLDKDAVSGAEADGPAVADPDPAPEVKLPERNKNNDEVIRYLVENRKLDADLVGEMIRRNVLYEDKKHHNVVFVGTTGADTPGYASWRGTKEEKTKGEVAGSRKEYSFRSLAEWKDADSSKIRKSENLFVFESPIDLLSFITLYPKYWRENHYLSLGGLSKAALENLLSDRPDVKKIYLCLDDDKAGHEGTARLFDAIPEKYAVTQLVPVKKDWNDVLVERTGAPDEKYIASKIPLRKSSEMQVSVTKMSEVKETVVEWLWYPFIPFGKVTLIQGDPGQGKTWLAMQLAAACTNRGELPNELPRDPFNVIYQTAEDGIGDTIKPRLIQCGADMDRVRIINEGDNMLSLTDPRLELAIQQNNVRLLILDPIQAYLGADVDMNRANEIRPLFRYLGAVAERTGAAIVLIGHLNKNAGTQANYRGLGSVDISAAVRSILLVGKVEKEADKDVRVVIQTKSSLAPKPTPVAFTLENSRPEWIGEYEITEQELMSGKAGKQKETKLTLGIRMTRELLNKRGVMYVKDLDGEGKRLNISERTMRNVRDKLSDELEYGMENGFKTVHMKKQE